MPRAGHHADVIVMEDVTSVQTPMGKIGIKIRIAHKDKYVPEFELKAEKQKPSEQKKEMTKEEAKEEAEIPISDEEKPSEGPRTESEHIAQEEERVRKLETYEEDEAKMKK